MPQVKTIFCLTKTDMAEIDWTAVTLLLGVVPTKASGPRKSPGRVITSGKECVPEQFAPGLTLTDSRTGEFWLHGEWYVELPRAESLTVEAPLEELERLLRGKETLVRGLCGEYGLSAAVIVHIYAEPGGLLGMELSSRSIAFWAAMGASVSLEVSLD